MCERRARKMRKGIRMTRLRETRRLQRIRRLVAPTVVVEPTPCPIPPVDKQTQWRLILELTLKTVSLMQKNRLIQRQILALKNETAEFVATVLSHPENKRRYLEHIREHGSVQSIQRETPTQAIDNLSLNKLSISKLPLHNLTLHDLPISHLPLNLSLNKMSFSNLPLNNLPCNSQPMNNMPFNNMPLELEPLAL